ncbi:DNA cytosine methyltransferase [Streptomyces rimosus]|uniref:DNA cytosine methyltransferase n=1 Tax=Streptomyces rimosus TaxID=1927 RepID=UPI0031CEF309
MSASRREGERLTSIEICAGAGGQAVGLHNAGFQHLALVELDPHAVGTLRDNVETWPGWTKERARAIEPTDVKAFLDSPLLKELELEEESLSLFAGGVPCPPFSLAGKRLGADDERDLFPDALKIIERLRPKAVMIENVRGILEPPEVFIDYRRQIVNTLHELGYAVPEIDPGWTCAEQNQAMARVWRRVEARNFGVPQLRPRAILVAIRKDVPGSDRFVWPVRRRSGIRSVVEVLEPTMRERCEKFWRKNVNGEPAGPGDWTGRDVFYTWKGVALMSRMNATGGVAPTLVGGSKKHGGADLGPSRAKKAWKAMGVDATGVANDIEHCIPSRDLFRKDGPMLTVQQAAIIQGFPEDWNFAGKKTAQYRQVGNAFPPPVAEAIGRAIAAVLQPECREKLLRDYVMEDPDSAEGVPLSVQTEAFPLSVLPAPGYDCSGDLVSAVC